ncbi:hypothetical protein ES705_35282 [subsurface metagenome]
MTIILDTNIVISALIRNSVVRKILLLPTLDFLLPEFAIEEIYHHKSKICKLSRIDKEGLELLISLILQNVNIISSDEILPYYDKAVKIIGEIDMGDVPFVALVLATQNDGIWTNDHDFDNIKGIKIWKTSGILDHLKKFH